MAVFEPYLAEDRLRAMVRGEELAELRDGAALFADVCGFTAHGEKLVAELGERDGAERLAVQLASVYDVILPLARAHGGAVVGFHGDAVTCWFEDDAARRAVLCAHAMQAELGSRPGCLRVKVAVAAGLARRVVAGAPEVQRLDLLVGATMDRMAAAERHARDGEVVVSREVMAGLAGEVDLAELRGESFAVLAPRASGLHTTTRVDAYPPSIVPDRAREWLLKDVYRRLLSGEGDFLAEFRRVTALFLGFRGLDYDHDDDVRLKLDAFVREVQRILTREGGHLIKLTAGDKGSYLLGVFGAPVAREDGPRHALAAALELQALGPAFDFLRDVRIGVSLGRMLTGAFGSKDRRAYDVLGTEANIAARLMQLAQPGETWVTPRVRHACPDFDFAERGMVQLRGRVPPLAASAVAGRPLERGTPRRAGATQGGGHQSALLGRDEERARIAARLDALAETGAGGALVVAGEAGIGKTRLVEDLCERAIAARLRVLAGAGDSIEQHTPYRALQAPFERILWGETGARGSAADLTRRLGKLVERPSDVELAPLLSAVTAVEIADNERTAPMTGPARADSTAELLTAILSVFARRERVVFLVEDSHWLDSASWAVLLHVRRTVPGVLLVVTTRPPPQGDADGRWLALSRFGRGGGAEWIRLSALSPAAAVALACSRLGVAALPEEIARLVVERAGGHPLFSRELAVALRERGVVSVEGGRCRIVGDGVALGASGLFDSVEEAITSRIDGLGPGEQLALKVASVIGREFSADDVRSVHPVPAHRPRIAEFLEEAARLGIAQPAGEPGRGLYTFHAVTHEVVYGLLPTDQRRDLHRAVGELFESAGGADAARRYPLLAHHFVGADLPAKAVPYLEKAGEQARRAHANREVVRFFTEALAMDERVRVADPVSRARWERQLGEALLDLGRFPESRERFLSSARCLSMSPPQSGVALGRSLALSALRQVLHRRLPERFVGREGERAGALLEAARVELGQAKLHFYLNEGPELVGASLRAMNIAERAGVSPELALAYSAIAVVAGVVPLRPLADTYCRLALAAAADAGDVGAEARVLVTVAVYDVGMGRWAVARERASRAREMFDRLGDRRQWEETLAVEAPAALHAGGPGEALSIVERLHASAKLRDDPHTLAWGLLGGVEIRLRDGSEALLPEARERIDEVESLFDRNLGPMEELRTHALGAVVRLRLGELARAAESAERALGLAKRHRAASPHTLDGHASVAEAFLGLWERGGRSARARWEIPLRGSVAALRAYAKVFPIAGPRALLAEARLHRLLGDRRREERMFEKALLAALALGMPHDAARVRRERAR